MVLRAYNQSIDPLGKLFQGLAAMGGWVWSLESSHHHKDKKRQRQLKKEIAIEETKTDGAFSNDRRLCGTKRTR